MSTTNKLRCTRFTARTPSPVDCPVTLTANEVCAKPGRQGNCDLPMLMKYLVSDHLCNEQAFANPIH
eukprot:14578394-Alexandrium_andersonii.AAC.1